MYLHLGKSVIVPVDSVVGVFDLDSASASKRTRDYLARAEKEGRLISIGDDLPRSFVVCLEDGRETIYLSQISPKTLAGRADVFDVEDE